MDLYDLLDTLPGLNGLSKKLSKFWELQEGALYEPEILEETSSPDLKMLLEGKLKNIQDYRRNPEND